MPVSSRVYIFQLRLSVGLVFACTSLFSLAQEKPIVLVANGRSEWHIVALSGDSSMKAALFIQDAIRQLSGAVLPINSSKQGRSIVVGERYDIVAAYHRNDEMFEQEWEDLVAPFGKHICVATDGGEEFMSPVYQFLGALNGTDLLAPGVLSFMHQDRLVFGGGEMGWNTPFDLRMPHYWPNQDLEYARWHLMPLADPEMKALYSHYGWGLWGHTMHRLVPPEKYFADHPEFYAERNDVRVPDQMCLSNWQVLRRTVEGLRKWMAVESSKYWSVSQMDNGNYCQCAQCHRVDSIEGSPSGSILRFVNAVADSFPDQVISTMAYRYSRTPPKVTKPRANVQIMLCSIEEDRSKPIPSRADPGSFIADLREWSMLARDILVWDYVINFAHPLAPFPNWKTLQPNLQLFRDARVPMVFEQGLIGGGGEMPEFRCYLLAKLLWDPDLDVDSLRRHFMNSYYGDAGVYIDQYTRLMEKELDKSGLALTVNEHPQAHKDGYLSPMNLLRYKSLFNAAEAAVMDEDPVYQQRVEAARLPIMYAELEVARAMQGTGNGLFERDSTGLWRVKPYFVELLDTFVVRTERDGNMVLNATGLTPQKYWEEFTDHFELGAITREGHAVSIRFAQPPDPPYGGGSPGALIDGFCSTMDREYGWQGWQGEDMVATIDLGEVRRVDTLEMSFLQDQQNGIFLPASIRLESAGADGLFSLYHEQADTTAARKAEPARSTLSFFPQFSMSLSARYLRITAKNLGPFPNWYGSKGDCWLFCDEIVVR